MKDRVARTRDAARSKPSRAVRPMLEGLEDRMLLYAATGDHFAFGSRITWSIVPDGTNLGGVPSNLVSTFNQRFGSPTNWLPAFQEAFALWEDYANVNLVQVSDYGADTGSTSYQQGSPGFGDIRIGGYAQAGNILAYTLLPPPNNGGSDSGDIFFNSAQPWQINSDYDLETVAIHEVGHALGLGHSADGNAAMYPYYRGVRQSPNTDDVNGIRAIWGPRAEDGLAAGNSNFSPDRAADITPFINGANDQIVLPNQDVASSAESYWFRVVTPANASNNLAVQVQSTSLSELSPRVQIYSGAVRGLVQSAAPANAYGATVVASIANATPSTTYYIRVLGSNGGPTGAGAYAMTVNMGGSAIATVAPPNTLVYAQPDRGGGGTYDRTGGANTRRNTPVDIPDLHLVGDHVAAGDDLVIRKTKTRKHAPIHFNVKHPINRGFVRQPGVRSRG